MNPNSMEYWTTNDNVAHAFSTWQIQVMQDVMVGIDKERTKLDGVDKDHFENENDLFEV